MPYRDELEIELWFERQLHQSRILSVFRCNPSTWELLLQLASQPDGSADGVYQTIERIETRYLGNSALLKFVRERRDDGLLEFTEHVKRSKWRIGLAPELREALETALGQRNDRLRRATAPSAQNGAQTNGLLRTSTNAQD